MKFTLAVLLLSCGLSTTFLDAQSGTTTTLNNATYHLNVASSDKTHNDPGNLRGGPPDLVTGPLVDEYTLIPIDQVFAMPLQNTIENVGLSVASDAMLTAKVFLAPDFINPIQTTNSIPTAINAGSNMTLNAGTFSPSVVGNYVIQYTCSATGNPVTSVDTINYFFNVTDSTFSRDNNVMAGVLGIGAGNGGNLGNLYALSAPAALHSVTLILGASPTVPNGTDTVFVDVFAFNNGTPTTLLGSSTGLIRANSDTLAGTFVVDFTPALEVTTDSILVCARELASGTIEVGVTTTLFTPFSMWVNWPTSPFGGWVPVEAFGASFARPFMIRPNFADICPPIAISFSSTNESCVGCNDGSANATPSGGISPYTYAWSPSGGTNASATGLAPGVYVLTVTDSAGCLGMDSVTINSFNSVENELEGMFMMYPNPSDGKFSVNFDLVGAGDLIVNLYSVDGKLMFNQTTSYQVTHIKNYDFSYLEKGTYLFNVVFRGKRSTRRIVIQ